MFNTIIQTAFLLPTSVIANGTITGNPFADPNNILLVDGQLATSNPYQAADITIGNFLVNLPQNAVITGMEMKLIAMAGSPTSPPISLTIQALDNTTGQDLFYPFTAPFTGLTTTLAEYTLGTSNYLFATSWTANQINNIKFALIANGSVSIDSFLVSVFYYIPATVIPPPVVPGTCIDCDSPIQVQAMYLELPFLAGQTKFYLQKGSFAYPDGTPVQPGDVGACGGKIPFVFDESKRKNNGQNFEENAILDTNLGTWTVLPSGVIEVDLGVVTQRGLDFKTPAGHVPSLMSDHDANSKVIISNNEPYNLTLVRRCQVYTVFSPPIIVENQGVPLIDAAQDFDFQGAGVSTINDPLNTHRKIITIPGVGGTTPPQIVSTTSNTSGNTQVTTLNALLQISGVNRGVVIQISTEQLQTVTSVLVGGVPAVQFAISTDVPNNLRSESWFCQSPPLGAQLVVITLSGAAYLTFGAECVNGVDPISPVGATQNSNGTNTTPNLNITTTTDYSIVIDGLGTAQTPILYTPGAGQSLNWAITANTATRQGGSSVESAGLQPDAITMQYSITQNTNWVYTALEIKGITSGSVTTDEKVKVDANDTTAGFLQPKLNIHSSDGSVTVVPTITNPFGNEIYDIDLTTTGGPGGGAANLQVDQTPDNGTYGTLAGAVNGINTTYIVSLAVYQAGKMLVYLNGVAQQLGGGDDWVETNPATGTFDFNTPPQTGDIITVEYQIVVPISAGSLCFIVNQTAHGFTVGQVLKSSGVDNQFALALADNAVDAEVVGIVTVVIDANNFTYCKDVMNYTGAGIPAGTPGQAVFLDPAAPGIMTMIEPLVSGTVSKPVGVLIATAAAMNFTADYRGWINP